MFVSAWTAIMVTNLSTHPWVELVRHCLACGAVAGGLYRRESQWADAVSCPSTGTALTTNQDGTHSLRVLV